MLNIYAILPGGNSVDITAVKEEGHSEHCKKMS